MEPVKVEAMASEMRAAHDTWHSFFVTLPACSQIGIESDTTTYSKSDASILRRALPARIHTHNNNWSLLVSACVDTDGAEVGVCRHGKGQVASKQRATL